MNRKQTSGQLVIIADDYGLSPGVNKGIEYLHKRAKLTSTSLLVNMPWAREAIQHAKVQDGLSVGIHLNLTTGQPIKPSKTVASLVNSRGNFYSTSEFWWRLATGRVRLAEVKAELCAQIEVCIAQGLHPTHLDSHLNFHAIPPLRQLAVQLAEQFDIQAIRNPSLSAVVVPPNAKGLLLQTCALGASKFLLKLTKRITERHKRKTRKKIGSPDCLLYLRWFLEQTHDPVLSLRECLKTLAGQLVEIVTHPAFKDEILPTVSNYVQGREREIDFLTGDSFSQILEDLKFSQVKPDHYPSIVTKQRYL